MRADTWKPTTSNNAVLARQHTTGPYGNHLSRHRSGRSHSGLRGRTSAANPREIAIANLVSISTKLGNNFFDVLAVPNQDGIREEAEAARLIHDLFQIARAEFS